MTTKQISQQHIARTIGTWGLSLGLLLVAAAVAILGFVATPASSTPVMGRVNSLPPQLHRLTHYLRAHTVVQFVWPEPVALDPAAQGVMDYLRAHRFDRAAPMQAVVIDPAAQSVLDYLRAHSFDQPTGVWPLDPNSQSVLDYLRAHGK
ncbi:MAG: hypothetical protein ACT4QE_08225 [Anaerolineales bacterium]